MSGGPLFWEFPAQTDLIDSALYREFLILIRSTPLKRAKKLIAQKADVELNSIVPNLK